MIPQDCGHVLSRYRDAVLAEASDHPLYLQILQSFNQTYATELVKASEGKVSAMGITPSNMAAFVSLRLLGFPMKQIHLGQTGTLKVIVHSNGRCTCEVTQ